MAPQRVATCESCIGGQNYHAHNAVRALRSSSSSSLAVRGIAYVCCRRNVCIWTIAPFPISISRVKMFSPFILLSLSYWLEYRRAEITLLFIGFTCPNLIRGPLTSDPEWRRPKPSLLLSRWGELGARILASCRSWVGPLGPSGSPRPAA